MMTRQQVPLRMAVYQMDTATHLDPELEWRMDVILWGFSREVRPTGRRFLTRNLT